ncbi:hypothetical protein NCCP2222_20320 [Sporosarcina sp. NCCP-2222]|uniref:CPBP family intramembrane glutamic endopeptidase n=1 Tax=Sporosarcina sp. NCCP-2222 TaxID=2935073 RepID=UPI00208C9B66|nr:CPBP family intramembrane glutamic endopeptidase [Sporosarcina sp. NCCP-2222]GKV56085.1 hypothetical protein NCCP2222_20320 [Sporosarcina sp. NCCP-2222]
MGRRNTFILLSPPLIILIGWVTAKIFTPIIQEWAWIPLALVYWLVLGICIGIGKGEERLSAWVQKPLPTKLTIAGMLLGMFPLSVLFTNIHLFDSIGLVILWLAFAIINPWFEEYYWRGILLDSTLKVMPKWLGIGYSTIFFVASHPLMWGVFSIANRSSHVVIFLSIIGVVWSLMYLRSKSLRWVIVSHCIVDIGIITVLVFLNIYIPPNG